MSQRKGKLDEARQMVELAQQKQVAYGINLNHRFTPAARCAKRWIDDGRLGKLHMINMRMWINNPVESSPWFHLRALHPHSFDVMRYFCGDVTKVAAFMMKGKVARFGPIRKSSCNLKMASSAISLEVTMLVPVTGWNDVRWLDRRGGLCWRTLAST